MGNKNQKPPSAVELSDKRSFIVRGKTLSKNSSENFRSCPSSRQHKIHWARFVRISTKTKVSKNSFFFVQKSATGIRFVELRKPVELNEENSFLSGFHSRLSQRKIRQTKIYWNLFGILSQRTSWELLQVKEIELTSSLPLDRSAIWFWDLLFKPSTGTTMERSISKNFFYRFRRRVTAIWIIDSALRSICKKNERWQIWRRFPSFSSYDISNDGQIDLKELTAVISAMVKHGTLKKQNSFVQNLFFVFFSVRSRRTTDSKRWKRPEETRSGNNRRAWRYWRQKNQPSGIHRRVRRKFSFISSLINDFLFTTFQLQSRSWNSTIIGAEHLRRQRTNSSKQKLD